MTGTPQIYLFRHGQTAWSLSGQHTGQTDLPLTAHGEAQAQQLAPRLREIVFYRVLTSPLLRARKTCELAGLAAPAVTEPDLAEWDYGTFEGKTSTEIHGLHAAWNVFSDGGPQGETPEQVQLRADRLIDRISHLSGNIALFSHGHFGRALAARWIGLPIIEGQHLILGEACVSILGYNPSHPAMRVIALWNLPPN